MGVNGRSGERAGRREQQRSKDEVGAVGGEVIATSGVRAVSRNLSFGQFLLGGKVSEAFGNKCALHWGSTWRVDY